MAALTRRRDRDCPDRWMIYFGDVRVGDIGPRAGIPTKLDQWGWYCGFDPPAQRRLWAGGTAPDFPQARQKFEAPWRELLPRFTEDDFAAYRFDRAWNAWKYRMWETGHKMPTQVPEGRSRCFCGTESHVAAAHMVQPANV
ncbi:hypothetical protein [Bradyrhizobium sp. BWA-3-5]|uniref:hypothetical protein n=1 Tax=Bradyrhizobium sp. BWA-3-5 TaxID=3080013 RepID=UPI00293E6206|nr:hypothetical protein [Bradyrhizobium sp. BWA-3-5]WOH63025.1 hypothetical protein RX331_20010 [Bradyrhizobium sp. BWA-3-5]